MANRRIIGNTSYYDIQNRTIKTFDEKTANFISKEFNQKNIPFSGILNGDNSKITVSIENLSEIDRIIADINIGKRLRDMLGSEYRIDIAQGLKRCITNTTTGEKEYFDSFAEATYAFELRSVKSTNYETEMTSQDEALFISEALQTRINELSAKIENLAEKNDWIEAKKISESINDLINRAMAIEHPEIAHNSVLASEVVDTISGERNPRNNILVGQTPQILVDIGCKSLPMLYTQQHLRNALHEKDEDSRHHGLLMEQIMRLPLILSDPLIVYESLSRDDSIIVVTSETDNDGLPIIAAIRPNETGRYEVSDIETNFLTSVHGRENFINQITNAINQNKILYAKENSQEWFTMQGLQLPEGFNHLSYNTIIHHLGENVNTLSDISANNEETAQIIDDQPFVEPIAKAESEHTLTRNTSRNGETVEGNKPYKYIKDKKYIKVDAENAHETAHETAHEIARRLNDSGRDVSVVYRNDGTATITVSGDDNREFAVSALAEISSIPAEQHEAAQSEQKLSNTVSYEIYQLPDGEKYHGIRFFSLAENKSEHLNNTDYESVYSYVFDDPDNLSDEQILNGIYERFNTDLPSDYTGRSLSMSDIVVIKRDNDDNGRAYYVDRKGFTEYPDFFRSKNDIWLDEYHEEVKQAEKKLEPMLEALEDSELAKILMNSQLAGDEIEDIANDFFAPGATANMTDVDYVGLINSYRIGEISDYAPEYIRYQLRDSGGFSGSYLDNNYGNPASLTYTRTDDGYTVSVGNTSRFVSNDQIFQSLMSMCRKEYIEILKAQLADYITDKDIFAINYESDATVTRLYYNPDSTAGGQIVCDTLDFEDYFKIVSTEDDISDAIAASSYQTLIDIPDPDNDYEFNTFIDVAHTMIATSRGREESGLWFEVSTSEDLNTVSAKISEIEDEDLDVSERLNKKIEREYNSYTGNFVYSQQIIDAIYEIAVKRAIQETYVDDIVLSEEQKNALLTSDNTLDEIYHEWLYLDGDEFEGISFAVDNTVSGINESLNRSGNVYSNDFPVINLENISEVDANGFVPIRDARQNVFENYRLVYNDNDGCYRLTADMVNPRHEVNVRISSDAIQPHDAVDFIAKSGFRITDIGIINNDIISMSIPNTPDNFFDIRITETNVDVDKLGDFSENKPVYGVKYAYTEYGETKEDYISYEALLIDGYIAKRNNVEVSSSLSLMDKLIHQVAEEYREFTAEKEQLPARDLLSTEFVELSAKRFIYEYIMLNNFSDEQIRSLLTSNNILDEIYQEWLSVDTAVMLDVRPAFSKCADAILESAERKEQEIQHDTTETISDKVSREYAEFLDNIHKEGVDVIIRSASEIAEKEKIAQYFEEYFDESSFSQNALDVMRNATHLLEDVYQVWTDMPNLSGVEDVHEAITTGIEYGKIRFVMPEKEEVQQDVPQIPLVEQVTKRLQDELAEFNAEMLKNDPSAILSRITEISAKREIAEYDINGAMELGTERLSALLTSKNILDEVYQEWLSLDTNGLQDIGLAFEECADAIMESMKREHKGEVEISSDEPVHDKQYYFEQAKKYINDFCDKEYGSTADFSNINEVGIGFTTITDDEIPLQINADLENYQIKYYLNNRLYKTEDYDSLQEMAENALAVLDFNELVYTVERDDEAQIQAFANLDTKISVPGQGISFDLGAVDEFVIEGGYSEYIGGMDENGHEARDNYQHYNSSLSVRLEGAKAICEEYNEKDMFSPYTEDIIDLLADNGHAALAKYIDDYAKNIDVNKIYTVKNGKETPVEISQPENVISQPSRNEVTETHRYVFRKYAGWEVNEPQVGAEVIIEAHNDEEAQQKAIELADGMAFSVNRVAELGNENREAALHEDEFEKVQKELSDLVLSTRFYVDYKNKSIRELDLRTDYSEYNETGVSYFYISENEYSFDELTDAVEKAKENDGAVLDYLNMHNLRSVLEDDDDYIEYANRLMHDTEGFLSERYDMIGQILEYQRNEHVYATSISENSEGIRIEGYSDKYSVINSQKVAGRELFLLESDERGDDIFHLVCDKDANVLYDSGYDFEDFLSAYTESEIAMRLERETIDFTVVDFDDGIVTAVFDGQLGLDDIMATDEYKDYISSTEFDNTTVHFEQYSLGHGGTNNIKLDDDRFAYIRSHLSVVKGDSFLIHSDTETIEHDIERNNDNLDVIKDLGLEDATISFAVVTLNDEKTIIIDSPPERHMAFDESEIENYVLEEGVDDVEISYDYYMVGEGGEADYADDIQKEYILAHLDEVISEADLLESDSFTEHYEREEAIETAVDTPDENSITLEYTGDSETINKIKDYALSLGAIVITDMAHGTISIDTDEMYRNELDDYVRELDGKSNEDIEQFSLFDGTPDDEPKTDDNILPYDVFRTNDGDKTVVSVDGDSARVSYTEEIGGRDVKITEIVSKDDLVNDNAYVGNDLVPTADDNAPKRNIVNPVDYRITNDDFNAHGNQKERFRQNVEAIKLLKRLEDENRTADAAEQEVLSGYVGWGGLPEAFDSRISAWKNEYEELKELLTPDEYNAAKRSTLNAHYTSPIVIETMYKALDNMGFKGGRILDPSVGTGNFLGAMPQEMYENSDITGIELDSITGRIAGQLYQSADIRVQGYEKSHIRNNSYDVAISNIPFGDYRLYDKDYDRLNFRIHDYFFAKSLDKVHPGGIVAFVTSSGTMDKQSEDVRRYIAERADFIGAIRLPNTAFKNIAGTSVTSDIIFLQKRDTPVAIDPEKEHWIRRKPVTVLDPRYSQPERNNPHDIKVGDIFRFTTTEYSYKLGKSIPVSFTAEVADISKRSRSSVPYYSFINKHYDNEEMQAELDEQIDRQGDYAATFDLSIYNLNNYFRSKDIEFIDNTLATEDKYTQLNINEYFVDHPEMVAGHIEYDTNPKSSGMTCEPNEDTDLKKQLNSIIDNISAEYRNAPLQKEKSEQEWEIAPENSIPFSFVHKDDKLYYRSNSDIMTPVDLKPKEKSRVIAMVELVKSVKELLDTEANIGDDTEDKVSELIADLNKKYDDFAEKYGRIGDKDNTRAFKKDVNFHLLKSLEKWDENLQTKERTYAGKADILTDRLLYQAAQVDHVETAADALIVSLSEKLAVDLDFMSHISDISEEDLIAQLEGQIYQDPEKDMMWVTAAEYLSGNIYKKLDAAEQAGLTQNADILRKYIPKKIEAQDILVKFGSTWIDTSYYNQFLSQALHLSAYEREKFDVQYGEDGGFWKINYTKSRSENNAYVHEIYGNEDMNAFDIAEKALNFRKIEIKKPMLDPVTKLPIMDDKGHVIQKVDGEATDNVIRLKTKLEKDFQDWLFKDPDRREKLVEQYNKTFNCFRPREYDGSFLNFVGKNENIDLMPHQVNAVARALMSGNTLLAHEVGAGKTYEMIAIAMEGKRLGQHKKSLIVTPNHLTEQFGQSFRELYPNANILVATSDDFSKENRRELIAKIATGDWDAVIIGHSQIGKLMTSPEKQAEFISKRISKIDRMITEAGSIGEKSFSVKAAEKMKQSLENKLASLLNSEKEDWISFEQLGVDKLFIDESQEFKNLGAITKMDVPGIGTSMSGKATNLKSITEYLDETTGFNGTVFATGTPVSNSLSEAYIVMEYLMEDQLNELHLDTFDKWASVFGRITEDSYLKADSSGQYEIKQKFANLENVAEFQTIFRLVADIRTADSLDIERPEAHTHTIVAKPSMAQKSYIKDLGKRADDVHSGSVERTEDNMLKITSDGRKCGLDMRCIDPNAKDNPNSKINLCVNNLIQIYNETTEKKGTQLVFCDLATPKPKGNDNRVVLFKPRSGSYLPVISCAYKEDEKLKSAIGRLAKRIENQLDKESTALDKKWEKEESVIIDSLGFKADPDFRPQVDSIDDGDIIVIACPDEDSGVCANVAYKVNGSKYVKMSLDEMKAAGIETDTEYNKVDRFCAYDDIKAKLMAAGIPEKEIAFIHDAKDEDAKLALYDAMNKGDIRVMIGSSAKCGAGMNAQKHMVAIHHLDAPLRPSDMTQRDGRGVRQGNENSEIDIFRYVTDRTFDSYIYQILETKQKGFSQIMTDKPTDIRVFEDIDEAAFDYGITKALCSGNPLIKEHADLQKEVSNLRAAKTQTFRQKYALEDSVRKLPELITKVEAGLKRTLADLETVENCPVKSIEDEKGNLHEVYPINILGKEYTDFEEAGQAISTIISQKKGQILVDGMEIGTYKGMRIALKPVSNETVNDNGQLAFSGQKNGIAFEVIGKDRYYSTAIPETGERKNGIMIRLNNTINGISARVEKQQNAIETYKKNMEDTEQAIKEISFDDTELTAKEERLDEISKLLLAQANTTDYRNSLYYNITDFCSEILESDNISLHYEVPGENCFMPLTIERHGNIVTMCHTYEQNGDLMYDPMIVAKLDTEARTMQLISFENSGMGIYQEFDGTMTEQELSAADYINDIWCVDIENTGWIKTDKDINELLDGHRNNASVKSELSIPTVADKVAMMGEWAEKAIVKANMAQIKDANKLDQSEDTPGNESI